MLLDRLGRLARMVQQDRPAQMVRLDLRDLSDRRVLMDLPARMVRLDLRDRLALRDRLVPMV